MVYYYTGILPKGIKKNPKNKYTGKQLKYIGAALFSDLNGQPEEVVAEELGADKLDGKLVRKKKCCRRIRSKSKKRSMKRSMKRSKKRSKKSKKRRSM